MTTNAPPAPLILLCICVASEQFATRACSGHAKFSNSLTCTVVSCHVYHDPYVVRLVDEDVELVAPHVVSPASTAITAGSARVLLRMRFADATLAQAFASQRQRPDFAGHLSTPSNSIGN